jgi:CHAT domain-containing protein/tetratricopeptide (TPR) repeat protein
VTRPPLGFLRYTALLTVASVALSVGQEREHVAPTDADALLVAGLFEQGEARARAAVDSLRASHGDNTLEVAAASDVLVRALVLNGRAAHDETLALARRALQIKEAHYGTERVELVPSLLNLCAVLTAAVDFNEAIIVGRRVVRLSERSAGTDSRDAGTALYHLGSALAAARRDDDALKVLERSVQLRERTLNGTDVDIARALEDLGLVLQRRGDYGRAGVALRRARAIQEASSINHPAYVRTLNLIADQLWFEGHPLESRDASKRAVELAERTLRADHPTVALSLRFLAATLAVLGDLGQSIELKKRALAIAERNFSATHPVLAEYSHSLGIAELDHGDYPSARLHFQQAVGIYRARYGGWHELVATGYHLMAEVDARLGDYDSAQQELHRAVAIYSRIGGPNHPYVAIALTELATVYLERGLPARALPLLQRALAIRERALGPQHRDVARTLVDMATTLMQVGRPARAQELATRALRISERLDAPDAPEYATILALYARLQSNRGNSAAARDYYERALAIRAKVFGPSHPLYAEAQSGLAFALAGVGDRGAALRMASLVEATGRDHLRLMLRSLPERQALNYAAARPRGLDLLLSLSDSLPEAVPLALDGVIRSRALVLDEIAARQSGGRVTNEDTAPRRALTAAQQRLANLMVRGPDKMSPAQYKAVMETARRESELAEQALASGSAEFRAERNRAQIGLEEVTAALPADGALVSFARYQRAVFDAALRTIPSYVALVLRRDQPPAVVPLGSAQSIDQEVSQWRSDISAEAVPSAQVPPGQPVRSSRRSGDMLRRRVWDRLTAYLGDATRVFIVPEGALSLVPFAALPDGQQSFILETGRVIHYLSAERDLVPLPQVPANRRGLLALGGPSFDDGSLFRIRGKPSLSTSASNPPTMRGGDAQACGSLQAASFQPLSGTLQEVRDLSGFWQANPATESEPVRVLVGRDASEAGFKREGPGSRVLHLATHGFFLSGSCSNAPRGSRAVGGLSKRRDTHQLDNPLLLSGLALAGANRRAAAGPEEDDGILTAEEVASLNLGGVEWAVLSACDTGVGEIKAGEGVFGLRRAFQVAGARTVIMSLWSVEDEATREWMRALYVNRLKRKLSTADAVHQANLTILRARRAAKQSTHPFFWAGFVAAGDWR